MAVMIKTFTIHLSYSVLTALKSWFVRLVVAFFQFFQTNYGASRSVNHGPFLYFLSSNNTYHFVSHAKVHCIEIVLLNRT